MKPTKIKKAITSRVIKDTVFWGGMVKNYRNCIFFNCLFIGIDQIDLDSLDGESLMYHCHFVLLSRRKTLWENTKFLFYCVGRYLNVI